VVLQSALSLVEGTLLMTVWPEVLRNERADRARGAAEPHVQRKWQRRARVAQVVAQLGPMLSMLPALSGTIGRIVESMTGGVEDVLKNDWRAVRRRSLQARLAFRRNLESLVIVVAVFGFLEFQPAVLRVLHARPAITPGFFSFELLTAIITLAGGVASMMSLNGGRWFGTTITRVAPSIAAGVTALGFYLACLLIAERLLFGVDPELWTWDGFVRTISDRDMVILLSMVGVFGTMIYLAVPWYFFDLNERSVHGFYRDSLGETFVIGSTPDGAIDTEGDLKLSDLNHSGSAAPLQLFNATLNLQTDPALRNTGRNGDFFLFTKDFAGSDRTGYTSTEHLEERYSKFTVASAMAASGAAASPHMGLFTHRPLVFVMSLLNIRLGVWLPNPMHSTGKPTPWYPNPFWLFREMRADLDARGRGIYVSDGGHLENLGLYQLLKRRCRVIIVVDATTDPHAQFQSLADAKRYARVDLDIEIEIDLAPLQRHASGLSRAHCATGVIRYPQAGTLAAATGILYLIKASLTGDEDVEIQAYKARASAFPHEPLSDQFFNEGQFEAYGLLGFHAAAELFAPAVFGVDAESSPPAATPTAAASLPGQKTE
jgi:hypothetical protein